MEAVRLVVLGLVLLSAQGDFGAGKDLGEGARSLLEVWPGWGWPALCSRGDPRPGEREENPAGGGRPRLGDGEGDSELKPICARQLRRDFPARSAWAGAAGEPPGTQALAVIREVGYCPHGGAGTQARDGP